MPREYFNGTQFFVGQNNTPTQTQQAGTTQPANQPVPAQAPATTATMTPKVSSAKQSDIVSPVVAPSTTPSFGVAQPSAKPPTTSNLQATPAPVLPQPQAEPALTEYTASANKLLETQRKAVEDAYKKQLSDVQAKIKEAETKQAQLTKQQEQVVGQMQPLTTPFRQQEEEAGKQRYFIEQNYQANQKLVNELDTLLTQSNNMMRQLQSSKIPGLAGLSQSPRAIQAMQDVSARVGVIQAVMSARNGQISQGQNMIDRTINAINQDRNDQLNYYKTVYDFYQNQSDEQGKKLYQLNQEEKSWLNKQIGMLETDLKSSQKTADYIKELMISPESAQFMADSGVTLNDSIDTIKNKMAEQAKIEVRKKDAEANKKAAFDAGITTPYFNDNGTIKRTADGWAFKDPAEFETLTGMSIAEAQAAGMISQYNAATKFALEQVKALADKYWDAGINYTDSLDTAIAKAKSSPSYLKSISGGTGKSGGGGEIAVGLYSSLIDDALNAGADPQTAVLAAMTAASDAGNKLTKQEQVALLEYAVNVKNMEQQMTPEAQPETTAPTEQPTNTEFGKFMDKASQKALLSGLTASSPTLSTALMVSQDLGPKLNPVINGISSFFK